MINTNTSRFSIGIQVVVSISKNFGDDSSAEDADVSLSVTTLSVVLISTRDVDVDLSVTQPTSMPT